ncbi:HU family DNA-binding protein [Candidatus Profftia tarda]|uniref:DNA-binding protein HU-beta n=1 Tax=Candidatus Profftia tarda TaxID=1177216 RepID=A0A8E4F0E3_9ENTR|nr:HU family DNA-binding protein [Candidatus Profftia tarda]CAD6508812.1 DNA-binding protein HU-beta [Candidatus Profftia tarda]
MNKSQLIDKIAERADISKASACRIIDAMISSIIDALKKGDSVSLVGFGTFDVRNRSARTGRNPKTGKQINIPAYKCPCFRAGKSLRDEMN